MQPAAFKQHRISRSGRGCQLKNGELRHLPAHEPCTALHTAVNHAMDEFSQTHKRELGHTGQRQIAELKAASKVVSYDTRGAAILILPRIRCPASRSDVAQVGLTRTPSRSAASRRKVSVKLHLEMQARLVRSTFVCYSLAMQCPTLTLALPLTCYAFAVQCLARGPDTDHPSS
eukprot:3777306-Rhodomonas_salina.2